MRTPILSPLRRAATRPCSHAVSITSRVQPSFHSQYHVVSRSHKPGPKIRGSVTLISLQSRSVSYEQKAKDLNQQGVDEALSEFDTAVAEDQEKQQRAPWHREGVDVAPVRRQRSAGAMTKGKHSCVLWFIERAC